MIWILLISAVLFAVGWWLLFKTEVFETAGVTLIVVFGSVFIMTCVVWPMKYFSSVWDYRDYMVVKQAIEDSREQNVSEVERAALLNKIIEENKKLASAKYWNNTIFKDMIYDKYAELPYLK